MNTSEVASLPHIVPPNVGTTAKTSRKVGRHRQELFVITKTNGTSRQRARSTQDIFPTVTFCALVTGQTANITFAKTRAHFRGCGLIASLNQWTKSGRGNRIGDPFIKSAQKPKFIRLERKLYFMNALQIIYLVGATAIGFLIGMIVELFVDNAYLITVEKEKDRLKLELEEARKVR